MQTMSLRFNVTTTEYSEYTTIGTDRIWVKFFGGFLCRI